MQRIRKSVFKLIHPSSSKKDPNFIFDVFIIVLIILNVIAVLIESVPDIREKYSPIFYEFELFSVVVFSIEYLFRLWTCVEIEKYKHPLFGRLRWIFSPFAIIDLLAILPFYLPFVGVDLRFIRIFRLFRIFRLLKIARYTNALDLIGRVIKNKKEELFITLIFCLILIIVSATLMYYAERGTQPGTFSSIPDALWWAVITLTTVGYGDLYPVTGIGRLLASIIAFIGIGLIALPTGILASGFSDELEKHRKSG